MTAVADDKLAASFHPDPPPHVAGQSALIAYPVCRHPDGSEHPAPDVTIQGRVFAGVCDQAGARLRWVIDVDPDDGYDHPDQLGAGGDR